MRTVSFWQKQSSRLTLAVRVQVRFGRGQDENAVDVNHASCRCTTRHVAACICGIESRLTDSERSSPDVSYTASLSHDALDHYAFVSS